MKAGQIDNELIIKSDPAGIIKNIMKKMDRKNYLKQLSNYYLELKDRASEEQTSDFELMQWDSVLSAVSKLLSPKKETEFVRAVLAIERQSLRYMPHDMRFIRFATNLLPEQSAIHRGG